ncbi:unnamed protein product [Plutella xylostella]|uniref:(diamondback moth) hypothetical protein n=1 Tax=Plutella xylostella TaxID=51655 RepID=A0A8S4F1P3_PLUXY|nr:unnamed protein product [Plutella xylostella]
MAGGGRRGIDRPPTPRRGSVSGRESRSPPEPRRDFASATRAALRCCRQVGRLYKSPASATHLMFDVLLRRNCHC